MHDILDLYAAAALQGLVAGRTIYEPTTLAKKAFELAQAMMEAREAHFRAHPRNQEPRAEFRKDGRL